MKRTLDSDKSFLRHLWELQSATNNLLWSSRVVLKAQAVLGHHEHACMALHHNVLGCQASSKDSTFEVS